VHQCFTSSHTYARHRVPVRGKGSTRRFITFWLGKTIMHLAHDTERGVHFFNEEGNVSQCCGHQRVARSQTCDAVRVGDEC